MEVFSDHKKLYSAAFVFFVGLSIAVAILPAINNQNNNAPLPGTEALSGDALAGKHIFIANGCVACHTQQVRSIDMDKTWGTRPGIAADYATNKRMAWWMNTATLMGTERTGPDLTNIGSRLPSVDWHLIHLFNPRAVVEKSIMPAYPWMFERKMKATDEDKVVDVPDEFLQGYTGKIVATKEALQLVAYLQSLKQVSLPDGNTPAFIYQKAQETIEGDLSVPAQPSMLDGAQLYANNCQACHQSNGEGLKGAFPPLKGSPIVTDENPEILINIIMNGYNAREEYAEMPAVGFNNELTPAQVTAIINHERTSWGNQASVISEAEVEKIIMFINDQKVNQ